MRDRAAYRIAGEHDGLSLPPENRGFDSFKVFPIVGRKYPTILKSHHASNGMSRSDMERGGSPKPRA